MEIEYTGLFGITQKVQHIDNVPVSAIEIDISHNSLVEFPDINHLINLKIIKCISNELNVMPNWKYLVNLESIDCSNNKLNVLPDWEHLINLKVIKCTNNKLKDLPNWEHLINLKFIECADNHLTLLPNWEHLKKLTTIDCSMNYLISLPMQYNSSLINLYCAGNKLTSLPDWTQLKNLVRINCSSNKLTLLPNWEQLKNLTYIDCSNNKLTSLHNLSKLPLTHLLCKNNKLTSLPYWLKTSNVYLDISLPFTKINNCYDVEIATLVNDLKNIGIITLDNKSLDSFTNKELCDLMNHENKVFILGETDLLTSTYENELECGTGNSAIGQVELNRYSKGKYIYYNKQCYTMDDLLAYIESKGINVMNKEQVGNLECYLTRTPFRELDPLNFDRFYDELKKMFLYVEYLKSLSF